MSREVAHGVYRLGTRWANFYLVTDGDESILVDAGYPRYWQQVEAAMSEVGQHVRNLSTVLVTHHHVDHVGTAQHLRSLSGARVLVHERDAPMVRGQRRSHVPPGFYRHSWRPSMARYLIHTVAAGGAQYRPVPEAEPWSADRTLDLPGRPGIIATPGHTAGHCSVALEERGVLFAGDAMVSFDYATGTHGVALHRFNEDRNAALTAIDRLDGVYAEIVLFGHGDPWTKGLPRAQQIVRDRARG
jgi:glyoxylase-like metal-dependent hydrolase (beta-lactamase superfamily II)